MSNISESEWVKFIPEERHKKEERKINPPMVNFGSAISFNKAASLLIEDIYSYKYGVILQKFNASKDLERLAVRLTNEKTEGTYQVIIRNHKAGRCGIKIGSAATVKTLSSFGFPKGRYKVVKIDDVTLGFSVCDAVKK